LSFQNIIVANIGWSPTYDGEQVSSAMGYVAEHGTGAEAYNFSPSRDGLLYGYIRSGERLAERSDRLWTVVFISKPREIDLLRVVGWYEDAVIGGYRTRPEYGYDPSFPKVRPSERFIFSAVAAKAFVADADERKGLILPRGHRIKTAGLYFAAGVNNPADSIEQRTSRATIAEWLRNILPPLRAASRLDRPDIVEPVTLPGIEIDDGGSPSGYSSVAESDEHRVLRLWAMANPQFFTGHAGPAGETEWPLPSGDRVDAVHDTTDGLWLIEAKSRRSGDRDLERGLYQCIKYRAVANAVDDNNGQIRPVHAVLLTERDLPAYLVQLAARHDIRHVKHVCQTEEVA
jgi:hypothetical protein